MKLRSFFLVNLSIFITIIGYKDTVLAALPETETIANRLVFSNGEVETHTAMNSSAMAPHDRSVLYHTNPSTLYKVDYNQRLSLDDIKAMSQSKIRDGVIIEKIQSTQSYYTLNNEEVRDLRNSGVSRRVIEAIQKNPHSTHPRRYQQRYQQTTQPRYQQPYQDSPMQYQRDMDLQQNYRGSGRLFKQTSPGPYYQRG